MKKLVVLIGMGVVLSSSVLASAQSNIEETSPLKQSQETVVAQSEIEVTVPLKLTTESSVKKVKVGETGKLALEDFEGLKLTGTYKTIKTSDFELSPTGEWKALKAGTIKLTPEISLAAASQEALAAKYPDAILKYLSADQEIELEVTDEPQKTLSVSLEVVQEEILTKVGETGQLTLKEFEGIKLTGTFDEVQDDPTIKLGATGKWEALEVGTTKLVPMVTLSAESRKAIEAKYPGYQIIHATIPPKIITVTVTAAPKFLSVPLSVTQGSITAKVGETGKLTLEAFEGIELTGTFAEIKDNPKFELNSQGEWKALAAGTFTVSPEITLSAESRQAIKAKYPNSEIAHPVGIQLINVTITDETTPSDQKTGEVPTKNVVPPIKKVLPKTDEKSGIEASVLGLSILGMSLATVKLKGKEEY